MFRESIADRAEMAEVFVSYSSQDRERVLPLVNLLVDRGIGVWIDRNRIPAATRYTAEISNAINAAKVVALFASSNAFSSRTVIQEIELANHKEKLLLPLYLDDLKVPQHLELILVGINAIRLHELPLDSWSEKICGSLRQLGIRVPQAGILAEMKSLPKEVGPSTLAKSYATIGPLTHYLVNRKKQNGELRTILSSHFNDFSRVPLVLITYGCRNQALLEYCQSFEDVYLPKALKHVGYPDNVKPFVNPPWPEDFKSESALSGFRSEVEFQLGLKPGSIWSTLGEYVAQSRSSVVLSYHSDCSAWNDAHFYALKRYIQSWAGLPGLPPSFPLIFLFVFPYQALGANWLDRFNRGRHKQRSIPKQIQALCELKSSNLHVNVLTELGNITIEDIEHWIRTEVKPPDPAAMIRKVREILSDPELYDGDGAPMSNIVERLRTVLEITVKEQLN